jgi:hypothetical protein
LLNSLVTISSFIRTSRNGIVFPEALQYTCGRSIMIVFTRPWTAPAAALLTVVIVMVVFG